MVKTACFVLGQPDLVDMQGHFRKDWPSGMLGCVAGLTNHKVEEQHWDIQNSSNTEGGFKTFFSKFGMRYQATWHNIPED